MSIFELRIYTLATKKDLDFYKDTVYARHMISGPKHDLTFHGVWTSPNDDQNRLFVLVSMHEDADPAELARRYMSSPEFAADLEGFDPSGILNVEATTLTPIACSPLQ